VDYFFSFVYTDLNGNSIEVVKPDGVDFPQTVDRRGNAMFDPA